LETKLDIIEIFDKEENPKDIGRELEIKVLTVNSFKIGMKLKLQRLPSLAIFN
jgi:hypothetical protein